jgi:hypothetical protein
MHAAEPLIPEYAFFEDEISVEKLKVYKSPSTNQIPTELFQAGDNILRSKIQRIINSIGNKEELSQDCKKSTIVSICKKGDKTVYNNCRGLSLLPTTYKILSSILISRLTPCVGEVIGDHQCGF